MPTDGWTYASGIAWASAEAARYPVQSPGASLSTPSAWIAAMATHEPGDARLAGQPLHLDRIDWPQGNGR